MSKNFQWDSIKVIAVVIFVGAVAWFAGFSGHNNSAQQQGSVVASTQQTAQMAVETVGTGTKLLPVEAEPGTAVGFNHDGSCHIYNGNGQITGTGVWNDTGNTWEQTKNAADACGDDMDCIVALCHVPNSVADHQTGSISTVGTASTSVLSNASPTSARIVSSPPVQSVYYSN